MKNCLIEDLLLKIKQNNVLIDNIYIFRNWIIAQSLHYGICAFCRGIPGFLSKEERMSTSYIGDMINKPVPRAVTELLLSGIPVKLAAGWACLNSALPEPDKNDILYGGSIAPFESLVKDNKTSFIGHFYEAEKWRAKGYPVNIVELFPQKGDIHWKRSKNVLKNSKVVFISGLTLLNGTFFEVIKRTPNADIRIIMGPSVPFSPILFNYGIHVVGSTIVTDIKTVVSYCVRGGGGISTAPIGAFTKVNITCSNEIKAIFLNYKKPKVNRAVYYSSDGKHLSFFSK